MDDDSPENPPGYYSTVARPDPGNSLPEPIGPRGRLVAKIIGAGFLCAAVVSAVSQLIAILSHSVAFDTAPNFVIGRFVALVLVPVFFGLLGAALLLHADDQPHPYLRPRRRADRRRR